MGIVLQKLTEPSFRGIAFEITIAQCEQSLKCFVKTKAIKTFTTLFVPVHYEEFIIDLETESRIMAISNYVIQCTTSNVSNDTDLPNVH